MSPLFPLEWNLWHLGKSEALVVTDCCIFIPSSLGSIQGCWGHPRPVCSLQEAPQTTADGQLLQQGFYRVLEVWKCPLSCLHTAPALSPLQRDAQKSDPGWDAEVPWPSFADISRFSNLGLNCDWIEFVFARMSTRVLLATLSIPITPERTDIARLLDMDGIIVEKHRRLATLLGLQSPPTRQSLINDMVHYMHSKESSVKLVGT